MELILNNKIIITPIEQILRQLRQELKPINGKLRDIGEIRNGNIPVTCPQHKDGFENHPSCNIYALRDNSDTPYGFAHCFTCGLSMSLPKFIGYCFDEDEVFGKEWLLLRAETVFISETEYLPKIELKKPIIKNYLSESELQKYNFYNDYMWKRKLTKEVVDKFQVGYNPATNSITFPVRDSKGNLIGITERNISNKYFYIPKFSNKPIYLLDYIIKNNITSCIITEGQIDALTSWSYGVPAIATIGTPSKYQISELNKSGIRSLTTLFDNDEAGKKFENYIKDNLNKEILLTIKHIPDPYKDINDLSKEQFLNLLSI